MVDEHVEELRADLPDLPKFVHCGQRDDALAGELLRPLGQLEQLHPGGDPRLGPAERLRGTVLGQASLQHRGDGDGLLVGRERLSDDVLASPVRGFGLAVADNDRHLGEAELADGGEPVKAGDEQPAVGLVGVGSDDERDEDALQRDRPGERLNVLGVELAHVLGHADLLDGDGDRACR